MLRPLKEKCLGRLIGDDQFLRASSSLWSCLEVRHIQFDSRQVSVGDVFFALHGTVNRGVDFIEQAIAKGASAVVLDSRENFDSWFEKSQTAFESVSQVILILVRDASVALAMSCKRAWNNPDSRLGVVGVTGTNGKTSVCWILAEALARLDVAGAGYLGTLGSRLLRYPATVDNKTDQVGGALEGFDKWGKTNNTTPDACATYSFLDEACDLDFRWVAVELSSHALAQKRVHGLELDVGLITNLTRDHLDYHQTMQSYGMSKEKIFSDLLAESGKSKRFAVFNFEDAFSRSLYENYSKQRDGIVVKGFSEGCEIADVMLKASELCVSHTNLRVSFGGKEVDLKSQLVGQYNVSNILAALCCLHSLGFSPEDLSCVLPKVAPVPGRMQMLDIGGGVKAIIDYAHTPDALKRSLDTIRALRPRRIITVFGCGGARDVGKRPLMGSVVAIASDYTIVTSDNPRNEDPNSIIRDIVSGMEGHNTNHESCKWELVSDRHFAIERALSIAGDGDVVLIAGKGHEDYQEVGGVRHVFSDIEEVYSYLKKGRIP